MQKVGYVLFLLLIIAIAFLRQSWVKYLRKNRSNPERSDGRRINLVLATSRRKNLSPESVSSSQFIFDQVVNAEA